MTGVYYETTALIKTQYFHHPQKVPHTPLQSTPSSAFNLRQPPIAFCHIDQFAFLDFYVNGIIHYMLF